MKRYSNITSQDEGRHRQYVALMQTVPVYFEERVTQKKIGSLVGMTPQTWNNRLKGQRLTMTIAELRKLALKTGMSAEDIAYIVMGERV